MGSVGNVGRVGCVSSVGSLVAIMWGRACEECGEGVECGGECVGEWSVWGAGDEGWGEERVLSVKWNRD